MGASDGSIKELDRWKEDIGEGHECSGRPWELRQGMKDMEGARKLGGYVKVQGRMW